MTDAEMCSLSSQDEEEDLAVVDPPPELVFINRRSTYNVGDEIDLELRNISSEEVEIKTIPEDVDIKSQKLNENESTKRYTLVPLKYGAYKVIIQMEESEDLDMKPIFIRVYPRGELKLRSLPHQVQLPRDVLVDETNLIIADGKLRKVIIMRMRGAGQEEFKVPCENFSPMGLAMKRDTLSKENNEVYVTDLNNACVHVYHGPNHILDSFGKNVLKRPTGIAIDDDGCIFVADYEAKRIFQFTPDYEPVNDEAPHQLAGPQLMTIQKCISPSGVESHNLLVADRRGSTVSIFSIFRPKADETTKQLIHVTDIEIDVDANCKYVMPFSVACDSDNHIFIAGQVMTQKGDKEGFIWFRDNNSNAYFSGCKMIDWQFGGGLRNPGGMRIVEEDGSRYLYITDMRGKNANNCINKYLL